MRKILITGATGFLGSRILDFYSNKYHIYAPTRSEMDITNEDMVVQVFEKYRPDIVLHCAAVSNVGLCEKEPEKSYKINVDGSIIIAKASGKYQAKCIICSSDQVYFGSTIEGVHSEEEELQPFNIYGQEKLEAEQECLKLNPDCVLLRLSWMYDITTLREGEHGDFFRNTLSQMSGTGELSYPIYDKRGITDVNEVVENLEKTFQIAGGVYNFGAPNDKDTYHTIYEVFSNVGLDVSRLCKNEEVFKDNPRNISMSQDKINECGIFFSSTANGLARSFEKVLINNPLSTKQ